MVFNLSHGFVAAVAETKAMFQLLISPSRPLSAFIFPRRTSFMHLSLHFCLAIWLHIPANAAERLLYTSHCPCPAVCPSAFLAFICNGHCHRWLPLAGQLQIPPSRTRVLPLRTTRHLSCHQQHAHTSFDFMFISSFRELI